MHSDIDLLVLKIKQLKLEVDCMVSRRQELRSPVSINTSFSPPKPNFELEEGISPPKLSNSPEISARKAYHPSPIRNQCERTINLRHFFLTPPSSPTKPKKETYSPYSPMGPGFR